jgi:anti-sigma factor ChrR (cupin superfamily)
MSPHIDSRLGPLELEQLSPAQHNEFIAHVEACPRCSREYGYAAETLAALGLALPPMQPPAELRERILHDVAKTNRFGHFIELAARIADVVPEKMSILLAKIDDPSSWEESPLTGVWLFPLHGGPATADAIVSFIKMKPACTFPEHGHLGHETTLVLQGSCRETSGRIARRGDVVEMEQGTRHELLALPGPDFVYLAVARGGISLYGTPILPDNSNR